MRRDFLSAIAMIALLVLPGCIYKTVHGDEGDYVILKPQYQQPESSCWHPAHNEELCAYAVGGYSNGDSTRIPEKLTNADSVVLLWHGKSRRDESYAWDDMKEHNGREFVTTAMFREINTCGASLPENKHYEFSGMEALMFRYKVRTDGERYQARMRVGWDAPTVRRFVSSTMSLIPETARVAVSSCLRDKGYLD